MTDGGRGAEMEWYSAGSSDLYLVHNLSSRAYAPQLLGPEKVKSFSARVPGTRVHV